MSEYLTICSNHTMRARPGNKDISTSYLVLRMSALWPLTFDRQEHKNFLWSLWFSFLRRSKSKNLLSEAPLLPLQSSSRCLISQLPQICSCKDILALHFQGHIPPANDVRAVMSEIANNSQHFSTSSDSSTMHGSSIIQHTRSSPSQVPCFILTCLLPSIFQLIFRLFVPVHHLNFAPSRFTLLIL